MEEIEFLKAHTLKENRKSYKKGDTQKVSASIAKRLTDLGIAKIKEKAYKKALK